MLTARHLQIQALLTRTAKALTARRSRPARSRRGRNAPAHLIAALASARCPVPHSSPVAVTDLLGQDAVYHDHAAALEAQGVVLTTGRRGRRGTTLADKTHVFVDPEAVTRRLLSGTRWSARDVARVLLGAAGAARRQRSVGGHRRRGVEVPLPTWAALAQGDLV